MVYHFSSKLAQGFRGAQQAASSSAGSAAGGAGGAKWNAGSRSHWTYQSQGRLVSQAPAANADSNSRLNDDESDDSFHPSGRPLSFHSHTRSDAHLRFHERRRSLSSSDRPNLLSIEENGLASITLSTADMQRRYRTALSRGVEATTEEAAPDADEYAMDHPSFLDESAFIASSSTEMGGSSSVASSTRTLLSRSIPSSPTQSRSRRALHTSAATFPSASPPQADLSRRRRYSASAIEQSSSSSSPLSDDPSDLTEASSSSTLLPSTSAAASPSSSLAQPTSDTPSPSVSWTNHDFPSQQALLRYNRIRAALVSGNPQSVLQATNQYLAAELEHNIVSHHAAMDAILSTRVAGSPIGQIVDLYTQIFNHPVLKPTIRTFELVLTALCTREGEINRGIAKLRQRVQRRELAALTRGPWYQQSSKVGLSSAESAELAALEQEDCLKPALKIYTALDSRADALRLPVINALLAAAVTRGRAEVALSIFQRLERSTHAGPNSITYQILLRMFGKEDDALGVKEVLEAYLIGRASGALAITTSHHQHSLDHLASSMQENALDFPLATTDAGAISHPSAAAQGDEAVWRSAIEALFEAGDSLGAVELVERMMAPALLKDGSLPVGYPAVLPASSTSAVLQGFFALQDFESARLWFDRMHANGSNAATSDGAFYHGAFSAAVRSQHLDSINHIYRSWIAQPIGEGASGPSDASAAITAHLAQFWKSESPAAAAVVLDSLLDIKELYHAAVKDGRAMGGAIRPDVAERIILALTHVGRFEEASQMYVQLIDDCTSAGFTAPIISMLSEDVLSAVVGFRPKDRSAAGPRLVLASSDEKRVGIDAATKAVVRAKEMLRAAGRSSPPHLASALVGSYVEAKKGSVERLSASQWLVILEAAAAVAANDARKSPAQLPSIIATFESTAEDWRTTGVEAEADADLATLAGYMMAFMDQARVVAFLSSVSPTVADKAARGVSTMRELTTPYQSTSTTTSNSATSPSSSAFPSSSTDTTPPSSVAASDLPPTLPTPPSTPPTYFAKLSPAPASYPPASVIDLNLSKKVDTLIPVDSNAAFNLAISAQSSGAFTHPEVLGRLVESLGRIGETSKAREAYLLAYAALPSFAHDPVAQSTMWVMLEDRMIIALCQAGALQEVAVHRQRLIDAGTAPSADGYAAMILNMHDTTDDAAVAMSYFEESQRLNVLPNVYLFNTLISKLSRARRATEALRYFEHMKQCKGLSPNAITYGSIINACTKTGDDKMADRLFQEMTNLRGFRPRIPPYNTMIQFYTQTKPDRDRALYYYDQLVRAGVQPTGHTYKLLLDVYGSIGTPDMQSMEAILEKLMADRSVAVTGSHWASMIHSLGCVQKDLDGAIAMFEQISTHPSTMRSNTALPDAVVYESLLNAFLAHQRPDLCEKYLLDMETRGVRMTAYIANTLIKGHASQNNLEAARAVFESLEDPLAGVAAAFNHTVHRSRGSAPVPAMGSPVYREPSTWEAMVQAEVGAKEYERAKDLLVRAKARAYPEAVYDRISAPLLVSEDGQGSEATVAMSS